MRNTVSADDLIDILAIAPLMQNWAPGDMTSLRNRRLCRELFPARVT